MQPGDLHRANLLVLQIAQTKSSGTRQEQIEYRPTHAQAAGRSRKALEARWAVALVSPLGQPSSIASLASGSIRVVKPAEQAATYEVVVLLGRRLRPVQSESTLAYKDLQHVPATGAFDGLDVCVGHEERTAREG